MSRIECPRCGEENPDDAAICWACYLPLKPDGALDERPVPQPATSVADAIGRLIFDAAPYVTVVALTSSGWWPRPARLPVLGAGALALATPFALDWRAERRQKTAAQRRQNAENHPIPTLEEAPIALLTQIVLASGMMMRPTAIRLREHGNVALSYRADDEWHHDAVLPPRVVAAPHALAENDARKRES